jgi:transposase InsO family protein
MPDDEAALTADIIAFATEYGRYGYRRIAVLLRDAGWVVNVKRVERIWRREGLKVPQRQPKRGRLWLNDGSCIRLRPEYPNHVGTIRNLVCEAMMMRTDGASYGDRERPTGSTFGGS